jgi:hypothetical protein
MNGEKKYLRRPDTGWGGEIDLPLLEILRVHLEQAGLPYEVLDNPPEPEGEGETQGETQRRRRSS